MKMTRFIFFALLLLGVVGCNESFETEVGLQNPATEDQTSENVVPESEVYCNKECASQILGYEENYYKLEHMRAAYSNLMGTTRAESDEIIEPTHYHYKFIPKDIFELAELELCKDLEFYPYPLDAIVSEGDNFETDTPNVRYAVVPVGYDKLPNNVERELLYEMFIPDDCRTRMPTRCSHIDAELADRLVDEAMRITGNEEEPINKTRASKWLGSGRIVVRDTGIGYDIPLRGVKVRITRAGITHTAITDSLGYFNMTDGFKYGATYSIIWERADWDIRAGATGQATYTGPKVTGEAWNCQITQGSALRIAQMHRACYRHFYQTLLDYPKAITTHSLKLSYMPDLNDEEVLGRFYPGGGGVVSDIRVWKGSLSQESSMAKIFATTCHEIGHAIHCFNMGLSQFNSVDAQIVESWADAVAYYTVKEESEYLSRNSFAFWGEYININELNTAVYGYKNALSRYKNEAWPINSSVSSLEYSPLFIDLIDDDNQSLKIAGLPNDVVSGYTLSVLGEVLMESYAIHSLKTALRANKPAGITNEDINTLFEVYEANWVD